MTENLNLWFSKLRWSIYVTVFHRRSEPLPPPPTPTTNLGILSLKCLRPMMANIKLKSLLTLIFDAYYRLRYDEGGKKWGGGEKRSGTGIIENRSIQYCWIRFESYFLLVILRGLLWIYKGKGEGVENEMNWIILQYSIVVYFGSTEFKSEATSQLRLFGGGGRRRGGRKWGKIYKSCAISLVTFSIV